MKTTFAIFLITLMTIFFGTTPSYAHEGKGHPTVSRAIRELDEAKEILGKISPDAGGHVAKASQSVDQAIQELSAVKSSSKKS